VVAATNRNLEKRVEKGEFREDLYRRLGVHLTIPPLRERLVDMERLVDFVLQNPKINPAGSVKYIENGIIDLLKELEYPGNFRQLEQRLRLAVMKARLEGVDILTIKHVEDAVENDEKQDPRKKPERRGIETLTVAPV